MRPERGTHLNPKVACPTCGRLQVYNKDHVFRPFCSERCKMIDLGHWANETYRFPVSEGQSVPEDSMPD
ncbi:MAG: DNA gyrase inhibitor YacG [Thiobacillaceae bacterium]